MKKTTISPQLPQCRTTNLDVSAFLIVRGFQIARVDLNGAIATFVFDDPDRRADSVIREFHNGGEVAASAYSAALKRTRDLMWEVRRSS
jgi:hypothetical protein